MSKRRVSDEQLKIITTAHERAGVRDEAFIAVLLDLRDARKALNDMVPVDEIRSLRALLARYEGGQ